MLQVILGVINLIVGSVFKATKEQNDNWNGGRLRSRLS